MPGERKIERKVSSADADGRSEKKILFDSWAQLDIKEEAELRDTNFLFEELKKRTGNAGPQDVVEFENLVTSELKRCVDEGKVGHEPDAGHDVKNVRERTTLSVISESNPITLDWVTDMIDQFKEGKSLQQENVLKILATVQPILRSEPNVVDITINPHSRMTVVGDLHGQFDDLLTIFKLNGMPNERHNWIFNGDFVDRGQHSSECCLTLFAFKILFPKMVHLNRGNHEARDLNSRDGFEKEIIKKYDSATFTLFSETFACLPLCCIVDENIFVVHGGLFYEDVLLQQIRDFDRFHTIPPPETLMEDMLWSDPCDQEGRFENSRGCACEFGPDVVDRFFANNSPLNMIIRSHECEDEGYAEWFGGKLYTVFSCSNYQGTVDNDGAYCILEKGLKPRFIRYYAQKDLKAGTISQRHSRLKEDIVTKLLTRICAQRLGLINYFVKQDHEQSGVVTRHQWSQGLQTVLGLHIPFLQFQQYLGLPELGVDGKAQGPIDYMDFCNRYLVYSSGMTEASKLKQASTTSDFFAEMMAVMFARRYELESLFRFFDMDGNGVISREEFATGLSSLATILGKTFTQEQVIEIVDSVDTDHSGDIDYNEFFTKFHTVDETLISAQRMESVQSKRATHLIGTLPGHDDTEVVDTGVEGYVAAQGSGLGRLHKVALKGKARLASKVRVVISMNRLTSTGSSGGGV